MNLSLRKYQMDGVSAIRERIALGDKVICYQGPTAMGKTRIFSYITYHADKRGNVTWIILHRKELLRQAHDALTELGVPHGLISPNYTPDVFAPTQVASIDTLKNRYTKLLLPKLIIVDEFHHSVSPGWFKVLRYFMERGTRIIGFTATPARLDQKGLGKEFGGLCDSLIVGPQPQELITQGFLAPPRIFHPTLASPENLHQQFGEFKRDEADAMMDTPKIIGDAVQWYSKICPNIPTIVFVPSLKMAAHVETQYRAAGYQAAMIDGTMSDTERKQRLTALGGGGLHILISCQLIDEGVDVPIVEGIQLLSPTASVTRFLQRCGRGARMFPGKKAYYLLDHVCSTFRQNMEINHGDPSWDREWSLEGIVKRKKNVEDNGPLYTQCPSCFRTHPKSPACPYCGFVQISDGRTIEQVAGNPHEIDPAVLASLRDAEANKAKMFRQREEGMCKTLDEWKALADKRGYSPGWAQIRYNLRKQRTRAAAPELQF